MKNFIKSVGAIIGGSLAGIIPTLLTDYILESTGVLPHGNIYVAAWLIWIVLIYRSIFTVFGGYMTAKFAPHHPLRHAVIGGSIGTAVSILGAIATANMDLGPSWYPWTLAVLTLPSAWLGGKLFKN